MANAMTTPMATVTSPRTQGLSMKFIGGSLVWQYAGRGVVYHRESGAVEI